MDDLLLTVCRLALEIVDQRLSNVKPDDASVREMLVQIIGNAILAYQHHAGEYLSAAQIKPELAI